jgi:outer membrane biosynthesis protein TonB
MKLTYFLAFIVFLYVTSCGTRKEKSSESTSESAASEEKITSDEGASQSWIDDSEMDVLSNTWVAEDDAGELSSTWTEDAYAEELSTSSGLANSWVDESGETVYAKAELPPEYVGGKEALFNYIKETIQYPDDVETGNIYVAFIIGSDGAVRDARVFKGVKESMDREALRIINNMPNWDPGMIDGEPVASVYGLPIIFKP